MCQWKCMFYVDGRLIETIVTAPDFFTAQAMIEGQYKNCNFQWFNSPSQI